MSYRKKSLSPALSDDIKLPADAEDTISSVSWSPIANHLAAASWDGKVRVYDVGTGSKGAARGVSMLAADGPLFDCDWAKDGSMVVAGGADKKLHALDVATGQQAVFGSHDAPVRGVRFVEIPGSSGTPVVASGSWDRTVRLWDLRQQNPAATIACKERVYSMDAQARLLVVATAERHIHLINLQNPTSIAKTTESQLKYQTKSVAVFPDGKGWATGTIDAHCGINAVDEAEASKINFSFWCHRDPPDARRVYKAWSVNSVRLHPLKQNIVATAGSDGSFHFWDWVKHSRLRGPFTPPSPSRTATATKGTSGGPAAITAAAFNCDGSFYAYATGYDWSRGCIGNSPQMQTGLALHPFSSEVSNPRKK